ncbi:MAG: nicotinate (nicotinamide) nucleotide adenylyltransferase [Planctomycetota bacterium]|nr:MAG: nicotinate (nicotinamide) nucleotide adenylyltransferase [Planctomycetota bacterium]
MRIGIFGGSFDPVHNGHLLAAECCREQAKLDQVLFVPAAIPPHKQTRGLASANDRLAMLSLAIGGHNSFAISTDEIDRGGISYTLDTLTHIARQHPGDTLLLILGPDALVQFPYWHQPQQILTLAELVAVAWESLDGSPTGGGLEYEPALEMLLGPERFSKLVAGRVNIPAIGIRSSDLRAAIAAARSIRYRMPRAVEQYIVTHKLYDPPVIEGVQRVEGR